MSSSEVEAEIISEALLSADKTLILGDVWVFSDLWRW